MKIYLTIIALVVAGALPAPPGEATRTGVQIDPFTLSAHCPPSFELTQNRCEFRSLYQLYSSAEGFGGLRVPLPLGRDNFSPQEIDLGRLLFFDPLLSADHSLSCAHCHHPDLGFADGRARSVGRGGRGVGPPRSGGVDLTRGAPSLWNVRFAQRLFWDGRAISLEQQARGPLFSADEMGSTPEQLESALSANATYVRLFAEAYGRAGLTHVGVDLITRALAAFESSLVSLNSRYDRYAHGDQAALTEQEKRGFNVFRSFTVRCSQCHTPPLFTNGELAVIGAPEPAGRPLDPGAAGVTDEPGLRAAFRIPTLRNIALTAPYMHSGSLATLVDVVSFYNDRRGHAVPPRENLQINWHIALRGRTLDAGQVSDLVAFLKTLTDESMMPAVPARVPSGLPVIGRVRAALSPSSAGGEMMW